MRTWLHGSPLPVSVISDHKNLEYFMSSRVLNRRQARWSLFLSEFNFQLIWGPGHRNVADSPSRQADLVPKKGDDVLEEQHQTILSAKHTQSLFSLSDSLADPTQVVTSVSALTTIAIDNSVLLECFKTTFQDDIKWREALAHRNSDFSAHDGMVFHKGRLFVPALLRADIFHSRHDALVAGHPGRDRTLAFMQRDYSWPGMQTYVRCYVQACDVCACIKTPRHKPYGLLQPLKLPTHPWKSITMDFVVKLPTLHGFESIWVVCDRMTHAAHFVPCKESMTAVELAWLFLDHIFRYHGLPESIISDCGSLFVSHFWKELTTLLQVDHRTSMAYHPQTDGFTERTNQTLKTYLCTAHTSRTTGSTTYQLLSLHSTMLGTCQSSRPHSTPILPITLPSNPSSLSGHPFPLRTTSLSASTISTPSSRLNSSMRKMSSLVITTSTSNHHPSTSQTSSFGCSAEISRPLVLPTSLITAASHCAQDLPARIPTSPPFVPFSSPPYFPCLPPRTLFRPFQIPQSRFP